MRTRATPPFRVRMTKFASTLKKLLIVKAIINTYPLAQIRTCLWSQHMSEGEPPGKTPGASKDTRLKATT